MEKPSVLIVGAGALGIVTGRDFSLAGADVSFLVRPGRLAALQEPQLLYCHDDGELKSFSGYKAFGSVAEAMTREHDFVIITLDGATCRGEEGTQLLKEIGEAMRDTQSVAVISGVGVREYSRQTMNLPQDRVIEGTMSQISWQTDRVTIPSDPPADPALLAKASLAYGHIGKGSGFMVSGTPAKPAKDFAALYNRSGVSKCSIINDKLYAMATSMVFAGMAAFGLAGWPDAKTMAKDKDLMTLAANAMKEIMRLPEHGWWGTIAGSIFGPRLLAMNNQKMESDCLPIDYSAFNKFMHGGKVREQDVGVIREKLESGRAQGRPMRALAELIERYDG
jgi:hypothetical protein